VKAVAGDPSNKEFQNIPTIAAVHHEKPYGGVYPYGMAEDEIRLCSQIMTILMLLQPLSVPYKTAMKTDALSIYWP
jgi:response regulator RpfG family c-di-GMP phosphodiesterase